MVYLSVSRTRAAIQAWVELKDRGRGSYVYWMRNLQFEIVSEQSFSNVQGSDVSYRQTVREYWDTVTPNTGT